jgi:SAM-dependent methyltransferase
VAQALVSRAAFDEVADRYDAEFTTTRLGRLLRQRVWSYLEPQFAPGMRVLELGCGTGEDALRLARRGVSVVATDVSTAMLRATAAKIAEAGLTSRVQTARLDARAPVLTTETQFDGAYANFGVLNCVPNRRELGQWLGARMRRGGRLVMIVMGPFCAWESLFFLARGDLGRATRRARRGGLATVGSARLPVWYPSPGSLAADFSPWFGLTRPATGIGSLLPPSYLAGLVARVPRLFKTLASLEPRMPLSAWWADHYLTVFERR